jgi:hypothetical protein
VDQQVKPVLGPLGLEYQQVLELESDHVFVGILFWLTGRKMDPGLADKINFWIKIAQQKEFENKTPAEKIITAIIAKSPVVGAVPQS